MQQNSQQQAGSDKSGGAERRSGQERRASQQSAERHIDASRSAAAVAGLSTKDLPPMHVSDEAKERQLQLAMRQGDALGDAADEMIKREADYGALQRAGDYVVGVAVENAEGLYELTGDGELQWRATADREEDSHLEICVRDAFDGRFIPALTVHATVAGPDGTTSFDGRLEFLWHPWIHHYGANISIPREGEYTVRVHIDPPTFMRHDKTNGRRYAEPVDVEFRGVKMKPAKKHSEVHEG